MREKTEAKMLEIFAKQVGYLRRGDQEGGRVMIQSINSGCCPFSRFECSDCVRGYNKEGRFPSWCRWDKCWRDTNLYRGNSDRYNDLLNYLSGNLMLKRLHSLRQKMIRLVEKRVGKRRKK